MKKSSIAFVFCILISSSFLVAQDAEELRKLAMPGQHHKFLDRGVGKWKIASKMWIKPGESPIESTGSMEAKWILGGRFVYSVWKGQYMGEPFEGHSTEGYDNVQQRYVGTWIDTTGTGIVYSTGTCDLSTNICTSASYAVNPVTGKKMTQKWVTKWIDNDNFVSEMFSDDGSGAEVKLMEVTAKRR